MISQNSDFIIKRQLIVKGIQYKLDIHIPLLTLVPEVIKLFSRSTQQSPKFDMYEHLNFKLSLVEHEKKFYNLGTWCLKQIKHNVLPKTSDVFVSLHLSCKNLCRSIISV